MFHGFKLAINRGEQIVIALGGRCAGVGAGPCIDVENNERLGKANIDGIFGQAALLVGLVKERVMVGFGSEVLKLSFGKRDGSDSPHRSFTLWVRGPEVVVESACSELCGVGIDVSEGKGVLLDKGIVSSSR